MSDLLEHSMPGAKRARTERPSFDVHGAEAAAPQEQQTGEAAAPSQQQAVQELFGRSTGHDLHHMRVLTSVFGFRRRNARPCGRKNRIPTLRRRNYRCGRPGACWVGKTRRCCWS